MNNVVQNKSSKTKQKGGLELWNGYAVADHIIQFNGLHYNDKFILVNKNDEEVTDVGPLVRQVKCFINKDCLVVLRGECLADYLQDKLQAALDARVKEFENRLMVYKPDPQNKLRKLLSYLIVDPYKLTVAEIAFKNFIIQVKSNILGRQVHRPAMPILVGEEGFAKTGFIRMFCSIFGDLVAECSLDQVLNTELYGYRLANKLIILIEELAGAGRADLEAWKCLQTSQYFLSRVMREKFDKKFRRKCTFVGTSNKFSWQQLKDATSNRRLIDLKVEMKMLPSHFEEIKNTINLWDIWQSVKIPESLEEIEGWNTLVDETIGVEQKKVKLKTFTEEFMLEFGLLHGEEWFLLRGIMTAMEYHARLRGAKKDISDNKTMANYLRELFFDTKATKRGLAVKIERHTFIKKLQDCYGVCLATELEKC